MSIVFGGDFGLREDAFANFVSGITNQFNRLLDGIEQMTTLDKLSGAFRDQTPRENSYVDDGFQNVPGTAFVGSSNISSIDDIQKRRITTQNPELTVYVKKRLFWSLRNEHDTKFMDSAEKLFVRSSKILFERKCTQIAAYETLTKMEKLLQDDTEYDAGVLELLINTLEGFADENITALEDSSDEIAQSLFQSDNSAENFEAAQAIADSISELQKSSTKARQVVEVLKGLVHKVRKTKNSITTTWVVDPDGSEDIIGVGRGSGVIEMTLIDSINTSLSLEYGDKGSFNFTVENPYNMFSIANADIEMALRSAYQEQKFYDKNITFEGPQEILERARRKEEELRRERNERLNDLLITISNPLTLTDVSEIVFEINPASTAPYKVTGRIGAISTPFHKDNFRIVLAQALDPTIALTLGEDQLVVQIFDILEQYVAAVGRISEATKNPYNSSDVKYARRQLRKFYLGKSLIQPMDGINVYMRGNTFKDKQVIGPLSSFINNSPFVRSFGDAVNDDLLLEEMRQLGIDELGLSTDLYRAIRTGTFLRNAGLHVFGGLVSNVSESYNASAGKYVLSVSGESNMKWLGLSRVNVTPSLDQAEGVLEDPLTPLDIKIDEATGLITGEPSLSAENKRRADAGLLYYTSGVRAGERMTDENIGQDVKIINDVAFQVQQHAPGLKYKWKQGIIAASRNVNLRTALDGRRADVEELRRDVGINVVKDAFANLDIADVISLLVTGEPHNYESFAKQSNSIGTFTPGVNNDPETYFHSFSDITRSTNRALGNFQPFKEINIDRQQIAKRLTLQTELTQTNEELRKLQSEIATIQDRLNNLAQVSDAKTDSTNPNSVIQARSEESLKPKLQKLISTLNAKNEAYTAKIKEGTDNGLLIYGDDINFYGGNTSPSDDERVKKINNTNKLRTKMLQIRPQLFTKFNTDNNLFVVSDDYDKDLDLQAFAINLNSSELPIWKSEYKHPIEICVNAAKVIDFEFFCDTQGNLRFRAPKYNKLPLSLLVKMILLGEQEQIELASPFIKTLFTSREESLIEQAQITELEIQVLGKLLNVAVDTVLDRTETGNVFVDTLLDFNSFSPAEISNIGLQRGAAEDIKSLRNKIATISGTESVSDNDTDIAKIQEEISALQDPTNPNVNANRSAKLNQLLQLNSKKQILKDTIKKIQERKGALSTNIVRNPKVGIGTKLNAGQIASIVEPFGDLIEDDYHDFLGPGSSDRFIIRDDQMINYDFKESDQNVYCRIDVTGQEDLLGEGKENIGGVPLIWAGATDFDLWKQYGWRAYEAPNKPFFKDGSSQCAPYALMLLTRQQRDIIRATITVTGNEYYQLGDVVYVNSKDLLYYVYGIRHSFSASAGTYTTTLDLRYGHALGEFLPTPLDVIGKNLIKNQRKFNTSFVNRRTAGNDIGRSVGIIKFPITATESSEDALKAMLAGGIGASNLIQLKNALYRINAQKNRSYFDQVDVRGFTSRTANSPSDEEIRRRITAVIRWLSNPIVGFDENDAVIKLRSEDFPAVERSKIRTLNEGSDPVDLSLDKQPPENIGRTPREEVYNISSEYPDDIIEIVITLKDQS